MMLIDSSTDVFRRLRTSNLGFEGRPTLSSSLRPGEGDSAPAKDRLELSNAHKLDLKKTSGSARNADVGRFMKSVASTLEIMKDLAKLAERENLTRDERLSLQEEMTRMQHRLARTTRKMKLVMGGATEEQANRRMGDVDSWASSMLQALSNARRERNTSNETGIHEHGDGNASLEIASFLKMPDYGAGVKPTPEVAVEDMEKAFAEAKQRYRSEITEYGMRVTGKTEDIKKLYEEQFRPMTRLTLKEIMENAPIRLDSAKNAAASVARIEDEIRKLSDMQSPLDEAYSRRNSFTQFYANGGESLPSAPGNVKEDGTNTLFDPIFVRLEGLWVSSALQGIGKEYLI